MTWTCKCGNVNEDAATLCLQCAAGRPAGLSEEERAVLDMLWVGQDIRGQGRSHVESFAADERWKASLVAEYRAARAPLEAEVAKLREQVQEANKSAAWWEDEHSRERDARHAWVAWARENGAVATGQDAEPEARRILKKKLLQRIPVGCPADGMSIREIGTELRLVGQWHENETTAKDAMGRKAMYLFTPIASQEQLAQQKPAASPPGEVITETPNLSAVEGFCEVEGQDHLRSVGTCGYWIKREDADRAAIADIRAAVERATKELWHDLDYYRFMAAKDRARIAELSNAYQQLAESSERQAARMIGERDAAMAEVERLKGELARAKEAKRCPADGMTDEQLGYEILAHGNPTIIWSQRGNTDAGAVARKLFTPVVASTQLERKDGDPGAKGEG